jgi:glycosyltransferase involved in cell wall biosynthesis
MKLAFVTNICAHYRVKTFETLARYHEVDYYFFSEGDEWYWQHQHGVRTGNFHYTYLPGFRISRTRISPTLPWELWRGDYDVYIKCINGRFALPMAYLIARLKNKPFVLWTGIWTRLQTPFHRFAWPLTRYIYHHADAIVVYGEHVKRYLVSEGVPAERIFIAAHAVDNDAYRRAITEEEKNALRQKLQIQPHQKVILYLGRLEKVKGLPYLLESFRLLARNDAVLVLAGHGSEREQLEQLAREKGILERVRFAGYVPVEQSILYYAIAWTLVLPSITMPYGNELWGLVVNEAFNQGVPVIATDAVGAAAGGLVEDGKTGLIVPERNSTALADGIRLILDNPELRHDLGQHARSRITDWDNERMVQGFLQAVAYVIDRQKAHQNT